MSEPLFSLPLRMEELAARLDRWGFPNLEDFEALSALSREKGDEVIQAEFDAIERVDRELGLFLPGQREIWEGLHRPQAASPWSPQEYAFFWGVRFAARFLANHHEHNRGGGQ